MQKIFFIVTLFVAACEPGVGHPGKSCYPNDTCNTGLICIDYAEGPAPWHDPYRGNVCLDKNSIYAVCHEVSNIYQNAK